MNLFEKVICMMALAACALFVWACINFMRVVSFAEGF